jgi:ABC-type antimicrobial peptide transport system permease subunit
VVFQVEPETMALQFASSLLIGICAGIAPAINSTRLVIVDGLRAVT